MRREQISHVRERLKALEHLAGREPIEERDRELQHVGHQLIQELAIEVRAQVLDRACLERSERR